MDLTTHEVDLLWRCAGLAETALNDGDEPFGSLLIGPDGDVLFEDRNRIAGGDRTRHPEFAIARWAAANLAPDRRTNCTVYTSGEHCPMCAAAHAWVGLGPIVFAVSSAQLGSWLHGWGVAPPPVATLPIHDIAPGIPIRGPAPTLTNHMRTLHSRYHGK